jgi:hypothetical protein
MSTCTLRREAILANACAMGSEKDQISREERLAAKLRENLRRRKEQGREMRESQATSLPKGDAGG